MFEDALRKLRDLQTKAERIDGEHQVPFTELFPDEFMLRNTEFTSIEAMIEASGYTVEAQGDFAAIPDDEWDDFIQACTRFSSWSEMTQAAGREWMLRQLDLG